MIDYSKYDSDSRPGFFDGWTHVAGIRLCSSAQAAKEMSSQYPGVVFIGPVFAEGRYLEVFFGGHSCGLLYATNDGYAPVIMSVPPGTDSDDAVAFISADKAAYWLLSRHFTGLVTKPFNT